MNKRISLGVAISLIAISCAITFVISWAIFKTDISSKVTGIEEREKIQSKVNDIDLVLRANYFGELNEEDIIREIADGFINGLDDNLSQYMTSQDYYFYQMKTQGVLIGAGVEIANESSGYFEITAVYNNSAASANELKVGDVITEINAESTKNMSITSARSLMTGAEGSKVNIKIIRNGEAMIFDLVHQRINITSVYNKLLSEKVGYIRIRAFNDTTAEQLSSSLKSLKEQGAESFIFDVRQTFEGELSALQGVLNQLLPSDFVISGISENKSTDIIKVENTEYLQGNTAVLVDSGTSYCGEVFALSLKHGREANIIGSTTKGNGLQMKVFTFKDSTAIRIPVSEISISESTFNKSGVKPDFLVSLPAGLESKIGTLDESTDTQLSKAVSLLLN